MFWIGPDKFLMRLNAVMAKLDPAIQTLKPNVTLRCWMRRSSPVKPAHDGADFDNMQTIP